MNVRSLELTRRRAPARGLAVMAVAALLVAGGGESARAQPGRAIAGSRGQGTGPSNSLNPYAAPGLQGRFSPYPAKDATAADRAAIAGRVYRDILDGRARRSTTPTGPAGGRSDEDILFNTDLAERSGRWSLRWQEAQDNAAKSLAARYRALEDHLDRMSALEDGRPRRAAGQAERSGDSKPAPPVAEIARFFRRVDDRGIDRVIPRLAENERPLTIRGRTVSRADRVAIAGRVYAAILEEAVGRYLASSRAGAARPVDDAIGDALLAERLGDWSALWSQAEDDVATSMAGRRAAVRSHVDRMLALETGRFLRDARSQASPPAVEGVDRDRFRAFIEIARFFRMEAESGLPEAARRKGTDVAESRRDAMAARIYQELLDGAVRPYREGGAASDISPGLDPRLAERLGSWSIRWSWALAGENRNAQFAAVRAHIERMASLEDGRSLHDAMIRVGGPAATATPRGFAEVARYFRLEALWELEILRSR